MLQKIRKNLAEANYGTIGLEIIVVILGILIAFQIDRWALEIKERDQEKQYIDRLREDLNFEIDLMETSIAFADRRIAAVQLLEQIAINPESAADKPTEVINGLEKVTWRSFPHISAYVYTELQNTGNLSLIRSEKLRRELAEYYSSIRFESMVGLDLQVQRQFGLLTAGILTTDELIGIEENEWGQVEPDELSERAVQIAEQLREKQEAIDLLPGIAQHHAFNRKVIGDSRERAKVIINSLDALIGEAP